MMSIIFYFCLLSVLTFLAYGLDKLAAKFKKRRISEFSLHLLALLGGWPGAMLGQSIFRHKTKKRRFRVIFWLTLVANLIVLISVAFLAYYLGEIPS